MDRMRSAMVPPISLLLAGVLAGCGSDGPTGPSPEPVTFSYDFDEGIQGWIPEFVDFPPGREGDIEFESGHRTLPAPLDEERGALFHSGFNLSDDLFMFHKRRVEGLVPGGRYRAGFQVGFATTVASGCVVGLALYLKAGAVAEEPVPVIGDDDGWVRLSADKGIQADTGPDAVLLGEMRNSNPDCPDEFGLGELGGDADALEVTAADDGSIWLFFGEESVFEVPHGVYYTSFEATLEPL